MKNRENMIGFLTEKQTEEISGTEFDYLLESLQEEGRICIDYLNELELDYLTELDFMILDCDQIYVEDYDEIKHQMCLTNYI